MLRQSESGRIRDQCGASGGDVRFTSRSPRFRVALDPHPGIGCLVGETPEPPHLPPPLTDVADTAGEPGAGEMREDMLKTGTTRRTRKAGTRAGPNRTTRAMLI